MYKTQQLTDLELVAIEGGIGGPNGCTPIIIVLEPPTFEVPLF